MRVALRAALAATVVLLGCSDDDDDNHNPTSEVPQFHGKLGASATSGFGITNLVTSKQDPDLINPWGIAPGEGGFWIADNGTGKVSIYDGAGRTSDEYPTGRIALEEGITGVASLDAAEGLVMLPPEACDTPQPAEFVFASEKGRLIVVNADVAPDRGFVMVDRSREQASYKGVALDMIAGKPTLLAADFHNGRIDMFDSSFKLASNADAFVAPGLPEGFAPFNVAAIGGHVYVAYAQREQDGDDEVAGPGLGVIAVFDPAGTFVGKVSSSFLNAPWGMALAPPEFSKTSALLVGNFGDGHITAVDATSLRPIGQLANGTGAPLAIEGLWGITFGDGVEAGNPHVLYFVAGPEDEAAGVYGRIEAR
jgi:uncharacterized protein (TIGR03118 family)